jgi:hypothetical protein
MMMRFLCYRALLCLILADSSAALAQNQPAAPGNPATQPAQQGMQIETVRLVALIKSSIMALQHANQTGNYSVLHDMGTPLFRERFDQAKLTAVFANLRKRNINLSAVLFVPPNLTKPPEMKDGNILHIVGDFPTQPLKIQYELMLLQIDGVWRIDGMAVDAVPVQTALATAPEPKQDSAPTPQINPTTAKSGKEKRK